MFFVGNARFHRRFRVFCHRLVGGKGALVDVTRGGFDRDDMRARGERRDVKGVECPVNLRGHLNRVGHWRGNLHIIITDYPVAVNDNVLRLIIIEIIRCRHIVTQWQAFTIGDLPIWC